MYRTPRAFVQFIGESDEVYNLSPDNILSVSTSKSLSSPAGSFEILFKSGEERTSSTSTAIFNSPATKPIDWWLERIHPMTVAIIAIGSQDDVAIAQRQLSTGTQPARGSSAQLPREFMAALPEADRLALERVVLMVGLVEDCSLSVSMTSEGPQRSLRVAGRDFGKILLDDNLTRLARARAVTREQETRMIVVGEVEQDMYQRFMDRASINSSNNSMFWKTMSRAGSDSKIPLLEVLTNIIDRAPSYNIQLSNRRTLKNYFDVGAVSVSDNGRTADLTTSRVIMSDDLQLMSVRATMTLLLAQGPVFSCLVTFAPPPLAEMFVDTYGLEARLVVRRPPFYRAASMPKFIESMEAFMRKARRGPSGIDFIKSTFTGLLQNTTDEFATSDAQGRMGPRGLVHEIDKSRVLSLSLTRSMANVISIYQIYPTILMRGEASETALNQGVTSYLYDLAAAQRYGTTRTFRHGCPWDLLEQQVTASRSSAVRRITAVASDFAIETRGEGANSRRDVKLLKPNVGSTELSLACAETMRQYFYNRDNPAMLSGQIAVTGNTSYRIGDRVRLPQYNDTIFYVEGVQHSYQYGRAFVTTLSVSRGQPFVYPSERIVPYTDTMEPVLDPHGTATRIARDAWTPPRSP